MLRVERGKLVGVTGRDSEIPVRCATASTTSSGRCAAPSARSLAGVFAAWDEAVGPQIAAHARPASLNDGRLVVDVDQPTWATQLRYLESDLLARLRDVAGADEVTSIELRVRPPR